MICFTAVVYLCFGCLQDDKNGLGATDSSQDDKKDSTGSSLEPSEKISNLPLAKFSLNKSFIPQLPKNLIEVEPLKPIVKDWEVLQNPYPKFKETTQTAIKTFYDLIQGKKNELKFSGWDAYLILHTLNVAYLVYRDTSFLDTFVEFVDYFRKFNGMNEFFDGTTPPQWPRLERYNIFYISPYIYYDPADQSEVKQNRGWKTLNWSDVDYSGLWLDQFLRFVQIVKANKLSQYDNYANDLISFSKRVVQSHEREWIQNSKNSGYYIFPKKAPFYLDGVEMPVNEAAIFGAALVRLNMLTNEKQWLERAIEMWNHWKKALAQTESGYITYPYVTGQWQKGWDETSSPSINTPASPSMDWFENFHKTALTLSFLELLNLAGYNTLPYLQEFYRHIVATKIFKNPISSFPSTLGHEWPIDSYHSVLPFGFDGWVALLVNDSELRQSALSTLEFQIDSKYLSVYQLLSLVHKWSKLENISPATLDPNLHIQKVFTKKLKFKSEQSEDDECTIQGTNEDGFAAIEFQHLTPKSNPLRLYLDTFGVLRLYVKGGLFRGQAYIPKNSCIRLYWQKGEVPTKYPSSEAENLIKITQYTPQWP